MREQLRRMYRGETKIDFLGKRKLWFSISALVILACLASLVFRGLRLGIEFEGGVSINAPIPADSSLADASDAEVSSDVRDALETFGADDAQIQVATDADGERTVIVQTKEVAEAERQALLVSTVAATVDADQADVDSERIGSKWGSEITNKALRALIIFLIGITIFISIRFEWKMALAALVAMAHDLVVTAGVYSIVGFEVTPSTVIAILTILGYSLYDNVVVFDKVEENTELYAATGRMTYQDSANLAMNQVFMRSLNTSLSTLLPVGALLFVGAGALGAETLKDLALALLVGLVTGAYSSIFVATPILAMLKEREPKYRSVREKVLRDAKRAAMPAAEPATAGAPAAAGAGAERPAAARTPARTSAAGGTAARPRPGNKKAKRRRRR